MIGKIVRVPLREVWRHEAHDFTRWIEDNIDVLSDVIDLELATAEREQAAGTFSVDVVAEDAQGNPVVIENQLEKSDHDHLGKLITYLTSMHRLPLDMCCPRKTAQGAAANAQQGNPPKATPSAREGPRALPSMHAEFQKSAAATQKSTSSSLTQLPCHIITPSS